MRLALACLLLATPALAADAPDKPKKDRATKTPSHATPPIPGAKPHPIVNIYNQWTHEWLAVDPTAPPGADEVNHFLRDHYTNKSTTMDPKLIQIVVAAALHFHSDVVDVVSGFRHPKFNLMLRKKGHQVARDSQHTHGNAIDFFVPQVTTPQLHAWAKSQKLGGVGLYMESAFVHMDTGAIRFWSGD